MATMAARGDAVDPDAFVALYERYEQRAFNLAYRITGSQHDAADATQEAFLGVMKRLPELTDREVDLGSYLFTATRNACYDLMQSRKRAEPSDSIPESAAPVGSGAGGLGLDPGDPEEDPDRNVLLASQQEEIQEANARLPERQREVLALRELEELSYDEIAEIMEMNRNSVAQLISRARINLRNELRGTALATVVASSPDCERALPLIAMRDDGQLDDDADGEWLEEHLGDCDRCRVAVEAMQEAGVSYRAWAPIPALPWLFKETMAMAAELAGEDWSEEIARHSARRAEGNGVPAGVPSAYMAGAPAARASWFSRRGVRLGLAAIAALLLLAIFPGSLGENDFSTLSELSAPVSEVERQDPPASKQGSGDRKRNERAQETEAPVAAPVTEPASVAPAAAPAPPAETNDTNEPNNGGGGNTNTVEASGPQTEPEPATVAEPEPAPPVEEPPVTEPPPTTEPPPCSATACPPPPR